MHCLFVSHYLMFTVLFTLITRHKYLEPKDKHRLRSTVGLHCTEKISPTVTAYSSKINYYHIIRDPTLDCSDIVPIVRHVGITDSRKLKITNMTWTLVVQYSY